MAFDPIFSMKVPILCVSAWFWLAGLAGAQNPTPLSLRGCSVIPSPRTVQLQAGEVVLGGQWTLEDRKAGANHIAVRSLARDLAEFHSLHLPHGAGAKVIRLAVSPGTVATRSEPGIDTQAYRLTIADDAIEVTGNGDPGLFYGVQTLVQLIKRDAADRLLLPKGVIEDWPRLQLRFLHWDTKHHQDRMETLKRCLDWAARFMGHHWRLLPGLVEAEQRCEAAQAAAQSQRPAAALGHLAAAHDAIEKLRNEGERLFGELAAAYQKSRFPKGQSVAGRDFMHALDDTKDHWADRTPDLGFMMAPERGIGLAQWEKSLFEIIGAYAKQNNVATGK